MACGKSMGQRPCVYTIHSTRRSISMPDSEPVLSNTIRGLDLISSPLHIFKEDSSSDFLALLYFGWDSRNVFKSCFCHLLAW